MLDSLRKGANTIVAKALMGLLVASFAVWGVADVFRMSSEQKVATVGSTKIDVREFQRRYRRQIEQMSQQMGQPVTADFANALGIPQQILAGLMSDAAFADIAHVYGLGVSDEALGKALAEDPTLRPPGADAFSKEYFLRLLAENGLTESDFATQRRTEVVRKQIENGIVAGVPAPDALIDVLYRFETEIRSIDYVTLTREDPTTIANPADADLAKWFEDHKSEFKAPEYRSFSAISVTPETIANPDSVSTDDAKKEYERTKTKFVEPEQRRIQQIVFPTIEEAKAAADKIKAGTTFDAVIAERNLKPEDIDLGLITKDKIVDPAVADAAFKLAANGVSDAITGSFGGAVVRVTEIQPEKVTPFETVEKDIKADIAKRLADQTVLDTHDEIEDARAGGATLKEIADRFKLSLITVAAVDASGNDTKGAPVANIPVQDKLIPAVFASDEGNENDPIIEAKGFVWYSVDKVTTARDQTLDEVKDKATAAWKLEQADKNLSTRAADMIKAAEGGQDLAVLATAAGSTVNKIDNFDRSSEQPELGSDGVTAAFSGKEGLVTSFKKDDGSEVVLKVRTVINPPFIAEAANVVDAKKRFTGELEHTLIGQYVAALEATLGSTINQQMVNAVTGASQEQ